MSGFGCGRCVECDGGRGYEFCVSPRGIIGDFRPLGPIDGEAREQERMRAERDDLRAQRDALAEALRGLLKYALNDSADRDARVKARAALAKVTP